MPYMNPDLKNHLTHTFTEEQEEFLYPLAHRMGRLALAHTTNKTVFINFGHHIEEEDDDVAYTEYDEDGKEFLVVIDKRLDFGSACELLCHELAHVHCWDLTMDKDDHCEEWGKSYSLMYREYLMACEEWNNAD